MISSSRPLAAAAVFGTAVVLRPAPARAQSFGIHTRAVNTAAVDAAALGDTLRASVGLYDNDNGLGATGGVAAWRGALRAYVGRRVGINETNYNLALGYARSLATRDLAGPLRGTFGAEVVGGYLHESYTPQDQGGLRVTAPLGMSLGDPSSSSLGVYVAPYAESGIMRVFVPVPNGCSRFCDSRLGDTGLHGAAGVGLGARASMGPLSLELMSRDITHRSDFFGYSESALGITYRLGW